MDLQAYARADLFIVNGEDLQPSSGEILNPNISHNCTDL